MNVKVIILFVLSLLILTVAPSINHKYRLFAETIGEIESLRPEPAIKDYWADARKGSDENGDGSEENPWRTITYALDNIENMISYPLNLHVNRGIYSIETGETFPVKMKDYISIIGEDKYNTVIDAGGSDNTAISCDIINISIENITVKGGTGGSAVASLGGGGIYIENASIIIKGCRITGNTSMRYGGGILSSKSTLKLIDSMLSDNYAEYQGGGFYGFDSSSIEITNTTIKDNRAGLSGGGIYNESETILIDSCEISGNSSAGSGSGILLEPDNKATIVNCKITDNESTGFGGGVYVSKSSPMLINTIISRNSALFGGGIYMVDAKPAINNTLISENLAEFSGGGIYCFENSNPFINFCTIADNGASSAGGIFIDEMSNPSVQNCIIWDNGENPIEGEFYILSHSDIENLDSGDFVSNFSENPLFLAGPWGNYYLSQFLAGQNIQSPCIDAGNVDSTYYDLFLTTTRTDGVFDKGTGDIGYHHPPHIQLELHTLPEYVVYTGEKIRLLLDLEKVPPSKPVDLYIVMVDGDENIYSAPDWETGLRPGVRNLMLPLEIAFSDAILFEYRVPSDYPPIGFLGTYTFYAGVFLSDSKDLISNVTSTTFLTSPPPAMQNIEEIEILLE